MLVHSNPPKYIDMAMSHPLVMIASDGIPFNVSDSVPIVLYCRGHIRPCSCCCYVPPEHHNRATLNKGYLALRPPTAKGLPSRACNRFIF